jgi:acetaldehyde dehydrogenase (acetylating)
MTLRVAILGSGNIGTDLMYKVLRNPAFELAGVAGADPASEGLARARALGIATSDRGAGSFLDEHPDVAVAFDATSAHAHVQHAPLLAARGVRCIDLTPAALGPAVVPDVNLDENLGAPDTNLVTCGAQATVPVVAALSALGPVRYAEIVSTVASRSAGPGTRSNIDEFTIATARSLETLGGAGEGKAIIILNPAEPPIMMRNAVYAEIGGMAPDTAMAAVRDAVDRVAAYVPGYHLATSPLVSDGMLTAFIEVEGAGDYLPRFAGNLDIMTSAAVRVAERYAERQAA